MTKQITQERAGAGRIGLDLWSAIAVLIAIVVVAPMVAVLWLALHPTENIWPHLAATVLPRYLKNTFLLMAGVGILAGATGAGAAWLVVMYRFPGRGWIMRCCSRWPTRPISGPMRWWIS